MGPDPSLWHHDGVQGPHGFRLGCPVSELLCWEESVAPTEDGGSPDFSSSFYPSLSTHPAMLRGLGKQGTSHRQFPLLKGSLPYSNESCYVT